MGADCEGTGAAGALVRLRFSLNLNRSGAEYIATAKYAARILPEENRRLTAPDP